MRRDSLVESGMMTSYGEWTGKYGVHSWEEFLNNPQAQEAAMSDWSDRIDHYIRSNHAARLTKQITGIKEDITVTESGLAAAIHKEGPGAVRAYFGWLEQHGWNSRDHQEEMKKLKPEQRRSFLAVETRLREFQRTSYKSPQR
jgi:hypothetical protein